VLIADTFTSTANVRNTMENDLVTLAEMALTKPSDFGWWGREEMFESWGFAGINKNRDSDLIEISNFDFITKDLMNQFPDDFEVVNMGHWAVGHVDQLIVRVLKDENANITSDNITEAFEAAMDWVDQIRNVYPIACDECYFDLVAEKVFEYTKSNIPPQIHIEEDYELAAAEILSILEQDESYDYDNTVPTDEQMLMAAYELRWCSYEEKEFWDEFAEWNSLPVIVWDDIFERPSGAPMQIPGQMTIYDAINDNKV